jgi:hypothetical protein
VEAIIDSSRSRTGSPIALKTGASSTDCASLSGPAASGVQQRAVTSDPASCFDMRLGWHASPPAGNLPTVTSATLFRQPSSLTVIKTSVRLEA